MGRSLTAVVSSAAAAGDGELKSSWPEMLGHQMVDAMLTIKADRRDVTFKVLGPGDPQPPDFDAHRVCLFVDRDMTVVRTPFVG